MIALLDTSQDLDDCAAEIAGQVGQLLTPLTGFRLRDPMRPWAIDNGAYAGFNAAAFMARLNRHAEHRDKCLFVVLPDVVGSARRTLEVYDIWRRREALRGWKRALACQDGQEHLPIPWDDLAAVFIGGSTQWKCSDHAVHIIRAAQALGKWVHVGRVNHAERWQHFEELGVDSVDGTGLARYSRMRFDVADRHLQGDMLA